MGKEVVMVCIEVVEIEIGGYYNVQIWEFFKMVSEWEVEGYDVGEEFIELISMLRRIWDEELEYLDYVVEYDV